LGRVVFMAGKFSFANANAKLTQTYMSGRDWVGAPTDMQLGHRRNWVELCSWPESFHLQMQTQS
jgi:hypothetical protein